ncbi:MAG TPA: efflux RND transporter permease subunit, partial [Acetobacteraceae bacterium]|nr:efflux RND transporter permease subunit [Acetobacteraceae bacterium]
MNFSAPFILRPVATILLAIGLLISGGVAYNFLPVSALPRVDIPVIVVFAAQPGADPETLAASVTAPLERHLAQIAGVTNVTSFSSTGSASIVVMFDIDRDIDAAAHDVQGAINAASLDLPSDLPTRPRFRKFNPADAPIMTIALTSDTLSTAQIYDAADSILAQRLSQISGVAQVQLNGAEQPAVRVRVSPPALTAAGISAQDVYTAIRTENVTSPVGGFEGPDTAETVGTNGQLRTAKDYRGLVLKSVNGAIVRLADVASVVDATANSRLAAWYDSKPAILLTVTKEADANVIETVDAIKAALPQVMGWMPSGIDLTILTDRTQTIRASVADVQYTLLLSIAGVLLVVFLFMRRLLPTVAAGVTVPLSLCGTLAAMWLYGFALDNFSLMALTISVGFVVDDAIVMIENIVRHQEHGETPLAAALNGARQIGFTVVSISLSLVAVFIPLLFMGGILGRLFHEFATTLTVAILISAAVSLTLTPMLCGRFMKPPAQRASRSTFWSRAGGVVERAFDSSLRLYARTLERVLCRRRLTLLATFGIVALTIAAWVEIPKGFFPTQDTGLLQGGTIADPSVSFRQMSRLQQAVVDVIRQDPAVAAVGSTVGVSSGFNSLNRGQLTVGLKPLSERNVSSEQIIARLRPKLQQLGGVQTYLYSVQDIRGGGPSGNSNQFVLLDQDIPELRDWAERVVEKLRTVPGITDVSSDQDRAGPEANVVVDRAAAARLGVSMSAVDNALNDAFSQRQMSIIYTDRNQYHVVLEVDPALQTDPSYLSRIYVGATTNKLGTSTASSTLGTASGTTNGTGGASLGVTAATSATPQTGASTVAVNAASSGGGVATGIATGTGGVIGAKQVPLGSVAHVERDTAPLGVRHQGQFPSATVTFNIADGVAQADAMARVQQAAADLVMPETVRTQFGGNFSLVAQSLSSEPLLLLAALIAIYIVLGVLYESLTQPITIISTLPSAGLGALLALWVTGYELSIMGIIGIL